jgi:hypothetical protein|tara:strand:- start:2262 stop:2540 length:279 start_codon:yes stop_codon:yes gene_type:complete
MSWDSYAVIILSGLAFGFYVANSFVKKCPKCRDKMKYVGVTDPRAGQTKISLGGMFKPEDTDNRIEFHYQCEKCQTQMFVQGRRRRIESGED